MGDLEAADMLRKFEEIRAAKPSAPSTGVTKGRNKPRRMGKKYGGGVRGRKANYTI
jgi:hypothetical protein